MSEYIVLIGYLLLALTVSFTCSIMESVLLTVTMPFIEKTEKERPGSTKFLRKFKTNIDRPISAILILNTIAHTLGASGVGAQAVIIWGDEYFGLISALLTLAILILSEILPKTIGAIYWKKLAIPSSKIINGMVILTYPLVVLSEKMTKLIFKRKADTITSREEISALADIGTQEGILQQKENDIIQNIINLKEITIEEAMTPRTVLVAAQEDMSLNEFIHEKKFKSFTRIPIFKNNIDEINGYILKPTVFEYIIEGKGETTLKEIRRDFIVAYNNMSLSNIWEELLLKNEHIALVTDQYGGVDGIITMEDIIESLIGREIIDERDNNKDMQEMARERWAIRQTDIENNK
ncbi:MAG: DUF21 domain-containing protein [Bacteroidetes bacterium]|nr:DUF21 domain-containing protein [Bacteroidota bacterium]